MRSLYQPNKRLERKETKQDRQGIMQNALNNHCLSFNPHVSCYPSPRPLLPLFFGFWVYCIVLLVFPLLPLAKLVSLLFGLRSCPLFLSSSLLVLWLCSSLNWSCFRLPSFVSLLFPFLLLFGLVCPSVRLVSLCVCVYPCFVGK